MKRILYGLTMLFMIGSVGCYHATIETGLQPSAQTIEDRWADSWIYGLVPPSTVETMEECPNGVARIETQLSFTNQLVNFITFGIYTPMEIVVTCASGEDEDGDGDLPEAGDAGEFQDSSAQEMRHDG